MDKSACGPGIDLHQVQVLDSARLDRRLPAWIGFGNADCADCISKTDRRLARGNTVEMNFPSGQIDCGVEAAIS